MTFGTFASGETVRGVFSRALPDRAKENVLDTAPLNPADVFAVTGILLQLSGAYYHVQPDDDGKASATRRILHVDQTFRDEARSLAGEWKAVTAGSAGAPAGIQELWSTLHDKHGDDPIFEELPPSKGCPAWWNVALKLFMAADETASDGVGWLPAKDLTTPWGTAVAAIVNQEAIDNRGYLHTIAFETNPDFANVLPKSRTPGVGCTLRSLSQNLALLPPRGVARAYWIGPQEESPDDPIALNLLIVPYPYRVHARSFSKRTTMAKLRDRLWGWFELDQNWLDDLEEDDVTEWVKCLLKSAKRDCEQIHGVIFPELSMTNKRFDHLASALGSLGGIELLIAGLSDNEEGREGNFVATRVMNSRGYTASGQGVTRIREKHHRWRMESSQIGGYALSSALPPPAYWWEKLDILSRSLDVFVFRKDSAITTLICEDLARVDPCQELVRSIGPNLVVALLMDSAQIKDRWPARYATVLAEDPGCSVLTLTSRGLLDRSNASAQWPASNAIALWRDDSGTTRSIEAPTTSDAVVLTLAGNQHHENSMDGRRSEQPAISWRYHGHQPVRAEAAEELRKRIWTAP